MNLFDICVITASNAKQADTFRALLDRRISHGLYPREIDFRVYSDPEGGRVGSGGGTLCALESLLADCAGSDREEFLARTKILMIHAGGESRRLPCYAPEGKIFAPLPLATSSSMAPVVLDMQLSLFLRYPWARGEIVVASGDVVIDFDTASLPDDRGDLCGFAAPASFDQGSRHGVFQFDPARTSVVDFHQKRPPEFLRRNAMLEGSDQCPIDTGIVSFGPRAAMSLLRFSSNLREGGGTVLEALGAGTLKFDLYLEMLTACLKGIDRDRFLERVSERSAMEGTDLEALFEAFGPVTLSAVLTRRTSFLHFGSLNEYPQSCKELIHKELVPFYAQDGGEITPGVTDRAIVQNSMSISAPTHTNATCYIDSSELFGADALRGGNLIVGARGLTLAFEVPAGLCIDQRRVGSSVFTMVYSARDTLKPQSDPGAVIYCGAPLRAWLNDRGLESTDLWDVPENYDLLAARLYAADMAPQFLPGYWDPEKATKEWIDLFRSSKRLSIKEINEQDSALSRDRERTNLRNQQIRERVLSGAGWQSLSVSDFVSAFEGRGDAGGLRDQLGRTDDELLRLYRRELLGAMGLEADSASGPVSFDLDYMAGEGPAARLSRGVKLDQIVWARSPVRLDLAGGWSDTPPYTLRRGGQVTNLAVNLNGQPPIQVFCRPTVDRHIRIHSIDLGLTETIESFAALADYRNPTSPFALPKAAFCLLGLVAQGQPGETLKERLDKIGCGMEVTLLCAVPKGSGLGTSSILGATVLASLQRFFGQDIDHDRLFRQVLQMEQMLTTCGGWQDQIGGVAGGVKYIECKPGMKPRPAIHQLDPFLFVDRGRHACFTLFYTGITRLAKNILEDVVAGFNRNTPAYLFTVDYVRQLSVDARAAVARRDLGRLAELVAHSWRANKLIHPGTTNSDVDAVIAGTTGLYRGMKLLGAGGGGYALFVSDREAQADQLRARLRERFEDDKARIVDFSLNGQGLEVSVS